MENQDFKFVASSSFGVASSINQEDGQQISLNQAADVFGNLSPNTFRSLDFEAGYSDDMFGFQRNIEYLINKKLMELILKISCLAKILYKV